jgi:hypothetical protein
MSALHVSAGAEGAGSVSANADWRAGATYDWGGSKAWNESHNQNLSA